MNFNYVFLAFVALVAGPFVYGVVRHGEAQRLMQALDRAMGHSSGVGSEDESP